MRDDSGITFVAAEREYTEAWANPNNTRFELPPVDVNKVIKDRYRLSPQKMLTRGMIWDMEQKKAWDPRTYIPYVASEGCSWGRATLSDGAYRFNRSSIQRGWIIPTEGRVLEDVFVCDKKQTIYFIGRPSMVDESGEVLTASAFQPLFHVWHAVGGSDDEPLNLWSIVLVTETPDARYHAPFEQMVRTGLLPGFIENYIKRDLHLQLSLK